MIAPDGRGRVGIFLPADLAVIKALVLEFLLHGREDGIGAHARGQEEARGQQGEKRLFHHVVLFLDAGGDTLFSPGDHGWHGCGGSVAQDAVGNRHGQLFAIDRVGQLAEIGVV